MTQFLEDAKKPGGLPSYTFIEPNMLCSRKYGPENDMHPAFAVTETGAATNVLYGEQLILTIYEALRKSSDWNSILFVITFDEHGGCYDHVPTPPPAAKPPDKLAILSGQPGYSGFDFKRYGVRVPAVFISPWIEQGTVCNTVFDHTSIIRTVSKRWLHGQHLTERDRNATDLSEILKRTTARTDVSEILPNLVPPFHGCGAHPLSDMHRHLLAAAADRVQKQTGEVMDLNSIETTEDAVAALDAREAKVRSQVRG